MSIVIPCVRTISAQGKGICFLHTEKEISLWKTLDGWCNGRGCIFVAEKLFETASRSLRGMMERSDMSGVMKQYFAMKERHKDAILFFQVGGFFQMYYYDAEVAVKELELTLVSRAIGGGKRVPMCGFPQAGAEKYANLLAKKGYRVVFCVQSDEREANGMRVRRIDKIVEPASDSTFVDVSIDWDAYLASHTFEDESLEKRKKKRSVEDNLLKRLAMLELDDMSAMQAWNMLHEWRKRYVK